MSLDWDTEGRAIVTIEGLEAILWDMDGTLIDSEPHHEWTYHEALKKVGIEPPVDLHDHILGHSEEGCYKWLQDALGLTTPYDEWVAIRYKLYLDNLGGIAALPTALALWRAFAEIGMRQAVVSNSDRVIVDANMRAIGFDPEALVSVTRTDVSAGKPSPEPYLKAAELLGVAPARSAAVEDSLTGITSAAAAGTVVISVTEELVGRLGAEPLARLEATLVALRDGRA